MINNNHKKEKNFFASQRKQSKINIITRFENIDILKRS